MIKNLPYLLALQSINGLGPVRLKALLEYFKDPKLVWEARQKELEEIGIPRSVTGLLADTRKKLNPDDYAGQVAKSGIKWLTIFDADYPELLKQIYDPPVVLFYKGEIPKNIARYIAVVGTRKLSGYGKMVTEKFVSFLTEAGLVITSGMARGVDTVAHQTAISAKGQTVAVMGGGLKQIFPPENAGLADKIIENGLGAVISEFAPDQPSLPGNFPARNRIISGLSLGVLVTEAAEGSGSLITAKCALDQGREVFAVPGPINAEGSKGTALLIKQGARLVTEPEEILEELGIEKDQRARTLNAEDLKLSDTEKKILECLIKENKHIDEICRELKMAAAEISAGLVKMEIKGIVKNLGGGNYSRSI